MRGITVRLVVALTVVAAFVVTALSGLVLYAPVRLYGAFGVPLLTWRAIHDWSALVLTVAVVVHLVLHRRRVAQMIAGLARPARDAAAGATVGPQGPTETVAATSTAPEPRRLRVTRKRFLIRFGALLAGFAGVVAVGEAVIQTRRGEARRAAAGSGIPGIASFPTLNVEQAPHVSPQDWVVTVDGLVDKPLRLDHAAWSALPRHSETADFHCVEGWSVDRLRWAGVAPRTILDMAGLKPGATHVNFHALGGTYADSLPMSLVDDAQTVLADTIDEAPLPDEHGGPLRLVVPKQLGYKNVKWVVRLEVTDHEVDGYWERNGYPADAPVPSV